MKKVDALLIPLVVVVLLLLGSIGFGFWAFQGRQTYKGSSDKLVASAVTAAQSQQSASDAKQFAEAAKLPLKTYQGPSAFGSLKISYPKTWSGYVTEVDNSSTPIDAYFQPDVVPGVTQQNTAYALRVQVISDAYSTEVGNYDVYVKGGKATANAFVPAKEKSVTGLRIDGQITPTQTGSVILLPLRDKTIKIWTESNNYLGDFNNNIIPNFSFDQ